MKTDPDCIFCQIIAGQMPCFKLLEDDDTLAFMDIYLASDGHCLVVAKDHYSTVFEISDDAFAAVSRSVARVQPLGKWRVHLVQSAVVQYHNQIVRKAPFLPSNRAQAEA